MVEDRRRPALEFNHGIRGSIMPIQLLEVLPHATQPENRKPADRRRTRTGIPLKITTGSILVEAGTGTLIGRSIGQQEKATQMNGGAVTHRNRGSDSSSFPQRLLRRSLVLCMRWYSEMRPLVLRLF